MTRWSEADGGGDVGAGYAARFEQLRAAGSDVHGEARFCSTLVPPPARVLDAGCGTGRVAIRLAELGYECVGVDVDSSMLAQAQRSAPALTWVVADLAALSDLPAGSATDGTFDLVVAAGNVVPFVAPGTEAVVVAELAGRVAPAGLLVVGYGLDEAHLPATAGRVPLADYDTMCAVAGLVLHQRFADWDANPYVGGGYSVSVHCHAPG